MSPHLNASFTPLDQEAIRKHFHAALRHRTPAAAWTSIADIPLLLAELDRTASLLAQARMRCADLLAAARATLAAHHDGEADPLYYLRDELSARQDDSDPLDDVSSR